MTINERIMLIIKELELNNNSFAKKLNVSPTVTFNVVGGRYTKPSYELLEKIILTFDNISTEWLLRERGEMFIRNSTQNCDSSQTIELLKGQLKEVNEINKRLLDIIHSTVAK